MENIYVERHAVPGLTKGSGKEHIARVVVRRVRLVHEMVHTHVTMLVTFSIALCSFLIG